MAENRCFESKADDTMSSFTSCAKGANLQFSCKEIENIFVQGIILFLKVTLRCCSSITSSKISYQVDLKIFLFGSVFLEIVKPATLQQIVGKCIALGDGDKTNISALNK